MSGLAGKSLVAPCFKCGAKVGVKCDCKPRGVDFCYLDNSTQRRLERGVERCESPIEIHLLQALQIQTYDHPEFDFSIEIEAPSVKEFGKRKFVCVPQLEILGYRADFVIFDLKRSSENHIYALVLECDGHEFHERTKEQAARDRSRDRELTAYGFSIFRFTGAEIIRDPLGAADEIVSYLLRGVA